jgi:hypothetical protein
MPLAGSATQRSCVVETLVATASEPITPMMDSARTALSQSVTRMEESGKEDYFARTAREPVIWFEVEDFLRYLDHFRNPSGVQRVQFEIYREAKTLDGISDRVRFCRLSIYSKRLLTVSFDAMEDILGAGDILARIPQIFPSDHAAPALFLFHPQGCGSRCRRHMAPDEPV